MAATCKKICRIYPILAPLLHWEEKDSSLDRHDFDYLKCKFWQNESSSEIFKTVKVTIKEYKFNCGIKHLLTSTLEVLLCPPDLYQKLNATPNQNHSQRPSKIAHLRNISKGYLQYQPELLSELLTNVSLSIYLEVKFCLRSFLLNATTHSPSFYLTNNSCLAHCTPSSLPKYKNIFSSLTSFCSFLPSLSTCPLFYPTGFLPI